MHTYIHTYIVIAAIQILFPFHFKNKQILRITSFNEFINTSKYYTINMYKNILPGGESNPGLPRDRRGYLPLYYRGHEH